MTKLDCVCMIAIVSLILCPVGVLAQRYQIPAISPLFEQPSTSHSQPAPKSFLGLHLREIAFPATKIALFANAPQKEANSATRSAEDAAVYSAVAPSVVLIATKTAIGSGTLIDETGDIITNWHVVKGFSEVAVVFKPLVEGSEPGRDDIKAGEVVRINKLADLALIRVIDVPADRKPIGLGDVTDIAVGSDAYAIGHPDGETWTFTKGIISQYRLGYAWQYSDKSKHKADVVQTQTPINPGNSGGPLLDQEGKIIGVNSFTDKGEGLNFAVSVDAVKSFLANPSTALTGPTMSAADRQAGKCAIRLVSDTRTADNTGSEKDFDTSCSGRVDAAVIMPDDTSKPEIMMWDSNGDGKVDVWFFSASRDGKWDTSFWDTDFDGTPNLACFHKDGAIRPTSCESYATFQNQAAQH